MAKKKAALLKPYQLFCEDCIRGISSRVKPGTADLVIADPPYNFKQKYADYDDSRPANEYRSWMHKWLTAAHQALKKHGALIVFVPDEWIAEVDLFCRQTLKMHRRNVVVWTYTFGQAARKSFTRSHTFILHFVKTKSKFTFNPEGIKVPSARQLVYNDKRQAKGGKLPDDTWCLLKSDLEQALRADGTAWLYSRVCGTYKEREDHSPNQIPVPLMDRLIKACSNPGELVVDFFCGTGSTGVAALQNGRRFLGIDLSPTCIKASAKRLDATLADLADRRANRGKHTQMTFDQVIEEVHQCHSPRTKKKSAGSART